MSVRLYMDVHVPFAITAALKLRGVDVLTTQADEAAQVDDSRLLDRAREIGRVLVSQDTDLLVEAARRQETGIAFAGVVYAHPLRISIGQCVADLELIAKATEPHEWSNRVEFLPL